MRFVHDSAHLIQLPSLRNQMYINTIESNSMKHSPNQITFLIRAHAAILCKVYTFIKWHAYDYSTLVSWFTVFYLNLHALCNAETNEKYNERNNTCFVILLLNNTTTCSGGVPNITAAHIISLCTCGMCTLSSHD